MADTSNVAGIGASQGDIVTLAVLKAFAKSADTLQERARRF